MLPRLLTKWGSLHGQDPIEWAKQYIEELNKKEEEDKRKILVQYSPAKLIEKDLQKSFNGGYLFPQQIYHQLVYIKSARKFQINIISPLILTLYFPD